VVDADVSGSTRLDADDVLAGHARRSRQIDLAVAGAATDESQQLAESLVLGVRHRTHPRDRLSSVASPARLDRFIPLPERRALDATEPR
jgi:hypothetical protein